MNHPTKNCLNCQEELKGDYCSNCGQSASVHRITFRETLDDFFSSSFALEGPLMITIKLLITNPGRLFREFISGRRKAYYKPVAFFVVLTAVYLILRQALNYDPFQNQPQMRTDDVPEQALLFNNAGKFMVANINNIMFFLVFTIGLSHKIFFHKKYNLAEYLTIGFYISGMYIIIGLLHMILSVSVYFLSPQINMIFLFFYLIYASATFHQSVSILSILKYILLSTVAVLLYVVLGFGFSVLIVWMQTG